MNEYRKATEEEWNQIQECKKKLLNSVDDMQYFPYIWVSALLSAVLEIGIFAKLDEEQFEELFTSCTLTYKNILKEKQ